MSESDALFETFEFEGVSLDNRVGLAPMTRTSATDDGRATERMARYYAKFARGGFGFLVSEGVYPDTEYSQGYLNQPGLATEEQTDAWEKVTEAVHEEGKPIFAQLMHAGAISQGNPTPTRRSLPPRFSRRARNPSCTAAAARSTRRAN